MCHCAQSHSVRFPLWILFQRMMAIGVITTRGRPKEDQKEGWFLGDRWQGDTTGVAVLDAIHVIASSTSTFKKISSIVITKSYNLGCLPLMSPWVSSSRRDQKRSRPRSGGEYRDISAAQRVNICTHNPMIVGKHFLSFQTVKSSAIEALIGWLCMEQIALGTIK